MARLLLVRHGETAWNASKTIQGHSDIALSDLGRRQAMRLRDRLWNGEIGYTTPVQAPLSLEHAVSAAGTAAGFRVDRVVSSDLRRSAETAAILAEPWRLPVEETPELREMNWGIFQGHTTAEVRAQWREMYEAWVADPMQVRPPGGETLREVAARTRVCFQRLVEEHAEETVIVVGHGGSLRTGLCHLLKLPASAHWQFRLDNVSLTVVDTYPEGAILSLLNDTSHLRGLS